MDKRIRHVVTKTQQEITTTFERDGDVVEVEIRACSALDDELRSDFHEEVRAKDSESVAVRSRVAKSNQGNETGQDVTVEFALDHQPAALNTINEIIQLGKDYYERQLERNLAREEDEEDRNWRHTNQQKYFDDEIIEEVCLLYRGKVEI